MRLSCSLFLTILFALFALVSPAQASESVTVSWDKNTEPDIAGYRVHYGTLANPYASTVDVQTNSANLTGLAFGTTYLMAVSAYNAIGAESPLSSPIVYTPTGLPASGQQVTLDNISSRVSVQTGTGVMIGGFIVQGTAPKTLVLRAIGPSLAQAGVTGALSDPVLDIRDSSGALIATNDSWNQVNGEALLALGLAPSDSREASLILTLPAGSYSAIVRGNGAGRGVALFELYNLDHTTGSVANISTRGRVETGDNVMIGGFIICGTTSNKVIVRAIGPSLRAEGISDALLDPTLEIYDAEGTLLASNDNWRSNQEVAIIGTTSPPTDNREAAIVRTLSPGAYSAIIRGQGDTTGVALFEVYALGQ
ncbi:MAG: fibronectin type III domain-containing protein [Chthoniobacterales bacterium]